MSREPIDTSATPTTGKERRARRGIDREIYDDEILTSAEAMQLLKIGRTKLWELTRESRIPAYRVGDGRRSELRYKRSELFAWLERNRI